MPYQNSIKPIQSLLSYSKLRVDSQTEQF